MNKRIQPRMWWGATAMLVVTMSVAGGAEKASDPAKKPYPLDTCVVSGEKLGGGGMKTYTFIHEGQEVKLCCKPCLRDFRKDPAKYMKKIQEAREKKG